MTRPTSLPAADLRSPVADIVSKYFGGDAAFFAQYQAACAAQFPIDLRDGQTACDSSNIDALMRTAHNLKSILLTLGFAAISQEAAACEKCSQSGQVSQAQASWNRLARQMQDVLASDALHHPVGT